MVVADRIERGDLAGDVEVPGDHGQDAGDEQGAAGPRRPDQPHLPARRTRGHMPRVVLGRHRMVRLDFGLGFGLGRRRRLRRRGRLGFRLRGLDHRRRSGKIVRSRLRLGLRLRFLPGVPPRPPAPSLLLRRWRGRFRDRLRPCGRLVGERDLEALARRPRHGIGAARRGQRRRLRFAALHTHDRGGARNVVVGSRKDRDLPRRRRVVLDVDERAADVRCGPLGRGHEVSEACNRGRVASMPSRPAGNLHGSAGAMTLRGRCGASIFSAARTAPSTPGSPTICRGGSRRIAAGGGRATHAGAAAGFHVIAARYGGEHLIAPSANMAGI